MTATILYGTELATNIYDNLIPKIQTLKQQFGLVPTLAVILIGENLASQIYVKIKIKNCQKLGIQSKLYNFANDATYAEVAKTIDLLNHDKNINGILIQLPLPQHLPTFKILSLINPLKDVDGFHPSNLGKLYYHEELFFACTPAAILAIIRHLKVDITKKSITIINNSIVVGQPLATKLQALDATVTVCNKATTNLNLYTKTADILITATGVAGLITGKMCKSGAIVIDVGINRQSSGTIIGDVDVASTAKVANVLTAVPGGVGPITVAYLMKNTVAAFKLQHDGTIK